MILYFDPQQTHVIHLFQSGGPSHLDLFDYKPELIKRTGQKMPDEILKNIRLAQIGWISGQPQLEPAHGYCYTLKLAVIYGWTQD